MKTEKFIRAQRTEILEQLKSFLRIPSISTSPEHNEDCRKAATWLVQHLADIGCRNTALLASDTHPVVYAEGPHVPGKPTVLVYGHYDVQPADPLDL